MSSMFTKCKHCGKQSGNHKAGTRNCPQGKKSQTLGYTSFHKSQVFEPAPTKGRGLYTTPEMTAFIDMLMADLDEAA